MKKLSTEQIAWVFGHMADHLDQGGSFSDMLKRLGLSEEAHDELAASGAIEVANILDWASQLENIVSSISDDFEIEFTMDDFTEPKKKDPGDSKPN